jgi:hypothetical protein
MRGCSRPAMVARRGKRSCAREAIDPAQVWVLWAEREGAAAADAAARYFPRPGIARERILSRPAERRSQQSGPRASPAPRGRGAETRSRPRGCARPRQQSTARAHGKLAMATRNATSKTMWAVRCARSQFMGSSTRSIRILLTTYAKQAPATDVCAERCGSPRRPREPMREALLGRCSVSRQGRITA